MIKDPLPYRTVKEQVDVLYEESIHEDFVHEQCQKIEAMIVQSGWDVNEFHMFFDEEDV